MMWWTGGWGWGLVMTLTMLGFWALVVWAVATFVRTGDRRPGAGAGDILAERFARGELDEDEYNRRRRLIER